MLQPKILVVLLALSVALTGVVPCSADPGSPGTPPVSPPAPEIIDAATFQGSSLSVGQGQTVVVDFGNQSSINLSGNIVNSGSLFAISSNPQVTTASFSALNITNQQGALFSSVLPTGGFAGITSNVSQLNLVLTAIQNVVNAGSIMSSGNLSVSAGGSIVNALPTGINGPSPIMQAMGAMNLAAQSGSIANAGLISSMTSNININAQLMNSLMVNNAGGRLEAISGQINIGNMLADTIKNNTSVLGGDLISRELNLFSGTGVATIAANNIEGLINISAGEAYVTSATPNLNLGSIQLTGDPAFYNTLGNVVINNPLVFSGQALAIVANGDILTAPGVGAISTASGAGDGGAITLVAGAEFTATALIPPPAPGQVAPPIPDANDANIRLTITGPALSGTGGKIDLGGVDPITSFDSSSSTAAGGNVTLIAYAGTTPGSGTINLPAAVTLTTGGVTSNGNVAIIAGANSGTPVTIGPINASGAATGGSVSITYAQPAIIGPDVQITGGSITAGAFVGSNSPAGNVSTGDLSIQSPTGVNISSPSHISLGNIVTGGAKLAVVSRGDILSSPTGSSIDTGSLTSAGGSILLFAGANVSWINPQTIHVTDGTAAGGQIDLTTGTPIGLLNSSSTTSAGNISIAAIAGTNPTSGVVTLPTALTITANGGGGVLDKGAAVTIGAGSQTAPVAIQIGSIQALSAVPHSNPSPNSITIQAGQPGANRDITGGAFVPTNGLSVFVSRGNSINTGALSVNGGSGSISIDSGLNIFNFSQTANIFVNGSISALGVGSTGAGVFIRTTSNSEFQIGPGAAGTGVSGTIITDGQAQAGTQGGGSISVQNWGTGGIRLLDINAISSMPNAGGGSGGAIALRATNIFAPLDFAHGNGKSPGGPLTIPTGTLSASGVGGAGNTGGTITLSGSTINVLGGNLRLEVNGSTATAVPGTIVLWASGITSDLTIGNGPGEISLSLVGSGTGIIQGRQIFANARDLTIDMAAIAVTLSAAAAFYNFQGERNLLVNGTINNGGGSSILSGPKIFLSSNSATPFTIGVGAAINGVTGSLIADNGLGGFAPNEQIRVENTGSGGITLISGSDILSRDVLLRGSQLDYRNGTLHGFDIALEPLSSVPLVTLGSAVKGAGFNLTQTEINQNTFATNLLRIGSQGTTNPTNGNIVTAGDIQITGSTSLSIHSNSSTIFNPGFSFSNAGHIISMGAGTLDISVQRDIDTGTITGTGGNMTIRTSLAPGGVAGSITVSAPVTTGGTVLLRANDNNSNIMLGANVSGSTVTLETGSNGNITQTSGLVSGNTVIMTGVGNFGTLNQQINTSRRNLQVITAGRGDINNTGAVNGFPSPLGRGSVFQVTSSGQLAVTGSVLGFQVALGTATGSNANILLQNNVTGTLSVILSADGAGSITRTAGVVTGSNVRLQSVDGNVGASGTPIQTAAGLLSINTGCTGAGFVNNTGATTLFNSSTGSRLSVSNNANISVSNVRTDNGQIDITTSGGEVRVLTNTVVAANGGDLLLQTTDLVGGTITLEANARLYAFSPVGGSGNVTIVVGPIPVPGFPLPPANVVVNASNGGQSFFGANSITALAPNNNINVDTKSVVFDTNGRPATAIQLNGGVTINATPFRTVVTSLDLTNAATVAELQAMQASGYIGGNLIASGGVATGGDVIVTPANLDVFLRSENIPAGVTLTMQDFQAANPVRISITNCSTCQQVIINGTHDFSATVGVSDAFLVVSSKAVPNLSIGTSGTLGSDGNLTVDLSGSALLQGQTSAANDLTVRAFGNISASLGNVAGTTITVLTAAGSNGSIMLGANFAALAIGISADGTGNISQAGGGSLSGTPVTLLSGSGSIGTVVSPILLAGGQSRVLGGTNAFLRALAPIQINASTVSSILSITGTSDLTILGALLANALTLQTLPGSNGLIDLQANVTGTGLASSVTLRADGSGEISQAGGNQISAQSLVMSSGTGNIGTVASSINTAVANLTANTGGAGIVTIRQTGNVTLTGNSSSGGDFNLIGMNAVMVAGNITTLGGPIGIGAAFGGAGGALLLAPGVSLTANDGPIGQPGQITLINNDTAAGQITIGNGASLRAYSNTPGAAQVFVLIGTTINPTPNPVPANVNVTSSNGGQVSFGPNGITAAAPTNNIVVDTGNVFFDTGLLPANRISLGGAVLVSATPPLAPPPAPPLSTNPILVAFAPNVGTGFPSFPTPSVATDVGGPVVQTDKLPDQRLPVSQSTPLFAMTANGAIWDVAIETDRHGYAAFSADGNSPASSSANKSATEQDAGDIGKIGDLLNDGVIGGGTGLTVYNYRKEQKRLEDLRQNFREGSRQDKALQGHKFANKVGFPQKLGRALGGVGMISALTAAAQAPFIIGYDCTGRVSLRDPEALAGLIGATLGGIGGGLLGGLGGPIGAGLGGTAGGIAGGQLGEQFLTPLIEKYSPLPVDRNAPSLMHTFVPSIR